MNAAQQQLVEMKKNIPDCTASRQRLCSILSDYFPTDKQLINAMLNAYNEDIETKLMNSSDPTLTALQLIKTLQNDYGLTSALNSVESWCYLTGHSEIADALESLEASQMSQTAPNGETSKQSSIPVCEIGLGVYKAGIDFPSGELSLQVLTKSDFSVNYGIEKNPNRFNDDKRFNDKTYITIEEGQYLTLSSVESTYRFRVSKID